MAKQPINEPPKGEPYYDGKFTIGKKYTRLDKDGAKHIWTIREIPTPLKLRAYCDTDGELHTYETEDFRVGAEPYAEPRPGGWQAGELTLEDIFGDTGRKHNHYFKDVSHLDTVDVYRVLKLFTVADPCLQHAIKKLLVAGGRGAGKDITQDIKEAIDSLTRWQELAQEDANVRS